MVVQEATVGRRARVGGPRSGIDGLQAALAAGWGLWLQPESVPGRARTVCRPPRGDGGFAVPWAELLSTLAGGAARSGGPVHPSVTAFAALTRTGLEVVADGRVGPVVSDTGYGAWRPGPLVDSEREVARQAALVLAAHGPSPLPYEQALRVAYAWWDELADHLVRTPGAPLLTVPGPFTGTPRYLDPASASWADGLGRDRAETLAPRLVIGPPGETGEEGALRLVVRVEPGAGGGRTAYLEIEEERSLRQTLRAAGAVCPALYDFAHRPEVATSRAKSHPGWEIDPDTALRLREESVVAALGELGMSVEWHPALEHALGARVVAGHGSAAPAHGGGLNLEALCDFRWQLTLDGDELTEEEMDRLAAAARPLARLRGYWVLVDDALRRRARQRPLPELPTGQALVAALSGTLTVDGDPVPCVPADGLAALLARLRAGGAPAPSPAGLTATLRDYQERALRWLTATTGLGLGALLADDMGLGKTITALALHLARRDQYPDAGPTLVVCPTSLVGNWAREAAAHAPDVPVVRHHGPERALPDGEFASDALVITTYGVLRQDLDLLAGRRWGLLLVDEAQTAKNPATGTARALRRLTPDVTVALTGTPVENSLTDLWALLDLVNPGLFGTQRAFERTFAAPIRQRPDHPAAGALRRLTAPFVLRRTKSDPAIAPELPDKLVDVRPVPLSREQAALYEAKTRDTLERVARARGSERSALVLNLITALRQICNHPAHYLGGLDGDEGAEDAEGYDPDAGALRSGKLAALDDLMTTISDRGEHALVFTSYAVMGRLLVRHLTARGHDPLHLDGQTPPDRREQLVAAFQSGAHRAFVITLKAGGTGLNLTRAAHVIHYDRPWNPAAEDQATDRAHRIGQREVVHVHLPVCENTVEDHVAALLDAKRDLAGVIAPGAAQAGTPTFGDLGDDELAALVRLGGLR
ncbi:DEAD/DEAH box helicase [Streptomyces sp. NPDC050085]|uniref:DEAD/DEAH box helicase n=1 Tax=Streptomyces sp. NPDC050085 TaxID=3365600 RepID=UPI0037AED4FB